MWKVFHEYRPNVGKRDPGAAGAICSKAHDDPVHERCVEVLGEDAAQGRKVDDTCMERGGFPFWLLWRLAGTQWPAVEISLLPVTGWLASVTEGLLQARPQPPRKDQPYFRTSTGQIGTGGVLANFAHQMEKLFNGGVDR